MICSIFDGSTVFGYTFNCLGSTAAAWGAPCAAAVILASIALAWRAKSRSAWLGAGLFGLAACLIAVALARPVLRQDTPSEADGGFVLVLVDRSESFWRDQSRAQDGLQQAARKIALFSQSLPEEAHALWRAQVQSFGQTLQREGQESALSNLPMTLESYHPAPVDGASQIGIALDGARALLGGKTGRKILIVLSDGHSTQPVEDSTLRALAAEGIELHRIARGAGAPASGLIAANIGPDQTLGAEVAIRATLLGGGDISVARKGQDAAQQHLSPEDQPRALRVNARFTSRGLQGLSLMLDSPAGQQRRDLFTLVRGPAKVLVFGPSPWAESLPPARWHITRAAAATPPALDPFEVVVIDALSPQDFPQGFDETLLSKAEGRGILLINGPLRGASTDPQRISDWSDTALDPILAVDSDPRAFLQEPPPRDIVIMVDTSGSMGGARLGSAKSVIEAILAQLRPQDSITILPFSDATGAIFAQAKATPQTVAQALAYTNELQASGGTAPEATILASARFVSNYCAFFFISDGDFAAPKAAPQCFTTGISVSDGRLPIDVSAWGEELIVGEGGDGRNLSLAYFEPEERKDYYRQEPFQPQAVQADTAFAPQIRLGGMAITYPRIDATVESLHDRAPPDPLFVWRRDLARRGVVSATFTGEMSAEWGASGLAASEAMLSRLIAWPDQDRYSIQLQHDPAGLMLSIIPLQPETAALSASLIHQSGASSAISLTYNPRKGAHQGLLPQIEQVGFLEITQAGAVQRIPISLPEGRATGAMNGSESLTFGQDEAFFAALAALSGARNLELGDIPLYPDHEKSRDHHLFFIFLGLAFVAISAAVWTRELRSSK